MSFVLCFVIRCNDTKIYTTPDNTLSTRALHTLDYKKIDLDRDSARTPARPTINLYTLLSYLRMQPRRPAPDHFCGVRQRATCWTCPPSAIRTTTTSIGLPTFVFTTGTIDSDTPL